jgi:hypothetical protein
MHLPSPDSLTSTRVGPGQGDSASTSAGPSPLTTARPSVLFYLVDDLGHYNVHFGGTVDPRNADMKTPHIQRLVSEGLILQRHCQ